MQTLDAQTFDRLRMERKWEPRERFAQRVRAVNRRAVDNPEEWIAELLETEEILG